jgi:ribosomal protein L15
LVIDDGETQKVLKYGILTAFLLHLLLFFVVARVVGFQPTSSLETLAKLNPSETVTSELLRERNIVKRPGPVKLLSDGEVSTAYTIRLDAVSEKARAKIQAAGGTVE